MAIPLPASFPKGTLFADVEGVPASLAPDGVCRAWDVPGGRRFSSASFSHNGTLVSEDTFRNLYRRVRADRSALAIVDNLNRRVMEEHARDVTEYQAIKARGETPPAWLAHVVENSDK